MANPYDVRVIPETDFQTLLKEQARAKDLELQLNMVKALRDQAISDLNNLRTEYNRVRYVADIYKEDLAKVQRELKERRAIMDKQAALLVKGAIDLENAVRLNAPDDNYLRVVKYQYYGELPTVVGTIELDEVNRLRKQVKELTDKTNAYEKARDLAANEIKRLSEIIDYKNEKIDDLEDSLQDCESDLDAYDDLESKLGEVRNQNSILTRQLTASNAKRKVGLDLLRILCTEAYNVSQFYFAQKLSDIIKGLSD